MCGVACGDSYCGGSRSFKFSINEGDDVGDASSREFSSWNDDEMMSGDASEDDVEVDDKFLDLVMVE